MLVRVMLPFPYRVVMAVFPSLERVMVPFPYRVVIVVFPSLERVMVPAPNGDAGKIPMVDRPKEKMKRRVFMDGMTEEVLIYSCFRLPPATR